MIPKLDLSKLRNEPDTVQTINLQSSPSEGDCIDIDSEEIRIDK